MTETVPASRQERRKAATRTKIVDAAETLFCRAGDATIEQIAETADVAVATVYTHFSGKQELRREVVERALTENERHMMAAYLADTTPFEKLLAAAAAYLRFYRESPQRFRLVALRLSGGAGAPDEADAMMAERVDVMTRALADVIADGVADGSFRKTPALETARFFWGTMNGVIALALRPDRLRLTDSQLDEAAVAGMQIVFEGLLGDGLRGKNDRLLPSVRRRVAAALSRPGGS